jgi:hypothetical protein
VTLHLFSPSTLMYRKIFFDETASAAAKLDCEGL